MRHDDVAALCAQGALHLEQGRVADSEACYLKALEIEPGYAEAHFKLGNIFSTRGQLTEAEACYRRAIDIAPDYVKAHYNLGNTLRDLSRIEEAEASYRRVLEMDQGYTAAHNNLGVLLMDQGRLGEAEESFRRVLELVAIDAMALNNLGLAQMKQGRLAKAESTFREALCNTPDCPEAYNNLGIALEEQGRLAEAEASYKNALANRPGYAEAYNNLGVVHKRKGHLAEAEASYRRALELMPNYTNAHSNLLLGLNYDPHRSASYAAAEARRFGEAVSALVDTPNCAWTCTPYPKRLKVGLVSGDLRSHSVGYFLESFLCQLDPTRIELIGYPTHHAEDGLTARIRPCFSAWKPISGLGDKAAANLIHADGVHILVDLSGHTAHNRLPVFAWKPAPVQASWLGYCATTGTAAMDYYIADFWTLPEAEEVNFTEEIWRLPKGYLCFAPPDMNLTVSPPPVLHNGYCTFGSYNDLTKINDTVIALWARILSAVPGSQLLLKAKQLGDSSVQERISEQFASQNIAGDRLLLEGMIADREEHLASYRRIDIALDPFPYNGVTTSAEALWMGVPVLTCAGDRFLSRQGIGLLTSVGLADWIAADAEDYVAKAVAHATNLERLVSLRAHLRQQALASPLFDAPGFARNFADALWGMWQTWLQQQPQPKTGSTAIQKG